MAKPADSGGGQIFGCLLVLVILGGALWVGMTRVSSVEADERTRCQEALKLGLEQNTPGPGWEVVLKVPGKEHTPQRICSGPQVDREKKQVVCQADVAGVGDARTESLVRQTSAQEQDVMVLLEWATR